MSYAETGRALKLTAPSIARRFMELVDNGILRRLEPLQAEEGRRVAKSPRFYLRDTGVLLHLLGIETFSQLAESTFRGVLLKGFMIEQIITRARIPPKRCFYFGRPNGPQLDLVLDRGISRGGFLFRFQDSVRGRDWAKLKAELKRRVINRGMILYTGTACHFASLGILAVSVPAFLDRVSLWMDDDSPRPEIRRAIREHNAGVADYYADHFSLNKSGGTASAPSERSVQRASIQRTPIPPVSPVSDPSLPAASRSVPQSPVWKQFWEPEE